MGHFKKRYDEEEIKSFFMKKEITAVLFVILIMYLFITSLHTNKHEEIAVNVFGFVQSILNKEEESNFEVIKDEEGSLYLTSFLEKPNSVQEIVKSTKNLAENINNKDTKLIYVMTPDKVIEGHTKFSRGMPQSFNNETADNFLLSLKENSLEYIDLRDDILKNSIGKEKDLFYKTDHHWKIETAFNAYIYLIDELNAKHGETIDVDFKLRDLENYNVITYENSYLGSLGRKVGKFYTGLDDFTLIYPKFNTSFKADFKTKEIEFSTLGRFEEALINLDNLKNRDLFSINSDKYSAYLFGNQGILHITNNLSDNDLKVLFVKDSLAVPLGAFMSNCVSEIYMIDPRYYEGDITEAINSYEDLDYVFISFSPQDLIGKFFRF